MIRKPIQRSTSIILGIVAVLMLLGAYTWISYRQHVINPRDKTIPTWSQMKEGVLGAVKADERTGERWLVEDAKATGTRLFLALTIGITGAILVGFAMGCLPPIEAMLHPPLSFFAKLTPTGAIAIFFVLAGTGTDMFVSFIIFGILPTLAITVFLAIKEFPDELQYKAYTLGASHTEVILTTVFPFVLPKLIDAIRLTLGPAIIFLIAAEMLVGEPGFGYRIRTQTKLLNFSLIYPYLTLLAGLGFTLDYGLQWMQRKLCPWYERHR